MSRRLIVVLFLALALATMLVPAALASDPTTKQVGLVVAFPDGKTHLEIVTVPDHRDRIRGAGSSQSLHHQRGRGVRHFCLQDQQHRLLVSIRALLLRPGALLGLLSPGSGRQ